jgi:uncharacterized protein YlxP (DUF503 family)
MVVGVANIDIHIPQSGSLKSKRHLLKGIKDRLKNKFNISIAEVGHNDLWQRATLGVAVVANEKKFANQVLSKVVEQINQENGLQILDYSLEIL